jgi:hypothetical protein
VYLISTHWKTEYIFRKPSFMSRAKGTIEWGPTLYPRTTDKGRTSVATLHHATPGDLSNAHAYTHPPDF